MQKKNTSARKKHPQPATGGFSIQVATAISGLLQSNKLMMAWARHLDPGHHLDPSGDFSTVWNM